MEDFLEYLEQKEQSEELIDTHVKQESTIDEIFDSQSNEKETEHLDSVNLFI